MCQVRGEEVEGLEAFDVLARLSLIGARTGVVMNELRGV